jgi:hypothetical protein
MEYTTDFIGDNIVERVIEQIKYDLDDKDFSALYELLEMIPKEKLNAYLPEGGRD